MWGDGKQKIGGVCRVLGTGVEQVRNTRIPGLIEEGGDGELARPRCNFRYDLE